MKRIVITFIVLLLLMSFCPFLVSAYSNTYKLDELGLELSIPSSYNVITQDTPTSSSIFDDLGISGKELLEHFKINGIYLNAISMNDLNEEIVVTVTDSTVDNLSVLSDTTIKTLFSHMKIELESYGFVVLDCDVYHHSQAKFLKVHFTDANKSVYGLQFYTTYDSKAMNFTMRSYSGELSQNQEETIINVVDSIKYDTPPASAVDVIETDAFVYTDVDTNTKFTVPSNWCEKELSKEREFIDAKFVSTKEDGMVIMYGSTDVWEMMTYDEKMGLTRSDICNAYLTLEDVSALLDVEQNKISKVNYNGIEYYQATIKSSTEMYGMDFIVEMTHAIRFENGWAYWFQFSGGVDSPYFNDLRTLLDSVQYLDFYNTDSTSKTNSYSNSDGLAADSSWEITFVVLIIIPVVIAVFVVLRYKKRSKHIDQTSFYETPIQNFKLTIVCKNCGQALPLDSDFCHKCGTKISKEDCSQ